jgi:tetratricopeptide (TPR) repeat protein
VPQYRQDLAGSHVNLGVLLAGLGKRAEAERHYRRALDFQEKLVAGAPAVPQYRQDLAGSHVNLGICWPARGNGRRRSGSTAKPWPFRRSWPPTPPPCPRTAGIWIWAGSHNSLGLLLEGQGKRAEAEQEYGQAVALLEKLAAAFPAVVQYRIDLGGITCNVGYLVGDSGRPGESLEWFAKAIRTLTAVYEQDRQSVLAKQMIRNSHAGRARAYHRLQKFADAVRDWNRAIELSPKAEQLWLGVRPIELSPKAEQLGLGVRRAATRVQAVRAAKTVAEVAELAKLPGWDAGQWYQFARMYAVASGKSADKQQEYADRALELLQRAVKAGYTDAHMRQDTDLDPLRMRADFQELIAGLEKQAPARPGKRP